MDARPPRRSDDATPPVDLGDRPTAPLPATKRMLAGDPFAAAQAGGPPPTPPPTPGPSLLVSRRTLLIAGGGLVAAGGAGVVAKQLHLLGRLRSKVGDLASHLGDATAPFPDGPLSTPHDAVIFDGALGAGWQDWSWAKRTLPDATVSHEGKPVVSMVVDKYTGLYFHTATLSTTGFIYLQGWVRGVSAGGQDVSVWVVNAANAWVGGAPLGEHTREGGIAQGTWRMVRVPLTTLHADGIKTSGVIFQSGKDAQGIIQLADLRLVYYPTSAAVSLQRLWTFDLSTITLAFGAPADPTTFSPPAAYQVTPVGGAQGGASKSVHPVAARYHPDAHTVSIVLPQPLQPKAQYTVTVTPGAPAKPLTGVVTITANPLTLAFDAAANRHALNTEIYGASGLDLTLAHDLGAALNRWGGEQTTRYNWKLGNAFNASRDYFYVNGNYNLTSAADRMPSGVVDQDIVEAHAQGMSYLLTIPTIGWVAKDDNPGSRSLNVPDSGGPPATPGGDAIVGYDPTANRQRTSVPSRARKGMPFADPPDLSDPTVAQDEWVHHLVKRFGRAADGGVKYYAMDNESELWWYQHADIKPAQLSYDQMRDNFLDYATAIKDVDPTAQILAPTMWYYFNLFYSPLDRSFPDHPDRLAHGDVPFLDWWLGEIRKHDEQAGRRTLDVLALHPYPQGNVFSDDVSPAMAALRLRSTRILWDPSYLEEAWIHDHMRLIPRLRDAIAANYPGTKIALSEYSWGAAGSVNGALAQAEVLGIFGREGADLAAHWGGFDQGSPAYNAFKLYGNYDSTGSSFSGTSFAATSSSADLLSCYAAQASGNGALLLMVLNKTLDSDITPTIRVANATSALGGAQPRRARVWRYWPDDAAEITRGTDLDLSAAGGAPLTLTYTFPASSMTLLRIEAGS